MTTKARRDSLRTLLVENGLSQGDTLHGWRCDHPDRYGECECLEELIEELMKWAGDDEG